MVELEEILQLIGVVLVGFELVDEFDLPVEQRLVASGDASAGRRDGDVLAARLMEVAAPYPDAVATYGREPTATP